MTAVVDIHCHAFNAADLPVRGFIHRLYLHKAMLGGALSELVDELLQGGAPGYEADLARLDALLGPGGGLEAVVVSEPQPPQQFEHEVDVAVAELQGRDPELLLRVGAALAEEEAPAEAGAESIGEMWDTARRAVRWVKLFGRSRLELTASLVRDNGDQVDLATPMLVDLGTGVGDKAKTTVLQQVQLFEKISRLTMQGRLPGGGKAHLHPFVGFDPLHELRARRSDTIEPPLEVVKRAVLLYGFVGVKLYPQMGWRPSGNQPRPGLPQPDCAELDRIVEELVTWCEAESVPVTAHCADSNYADDRFRGFGGPDDWLPVLRRHPDLRVNLGHFGGDLKEGAANGWPWKIARAAGELDGLFADVGNRRVDDRRKAAAYFDMLARMWAASATATMADRLMYGSDWYMLAINPDYDRFLSRYRQLYEERFGAERAVGFLGGNALSFLGFDDASNKNAQRLLARYRRFAPDRIPAWLAR